MSKIVMLVFIPLLVVSFSVVAAFSNNFRRPAVGAVTTDTQNALSPNFVHVSNGELLIVIAHSNASPVTSVTYAGVNLVKAREETTNGSVSIWYLANPARGANLVQVNYAFLVPPDGQGPGTRAQIALNISDANLANPIGATNSFSSVSGQPSSDMITTIATNSLLLDALALLSQDEGAPSVGTNQTIQYLLRTGASRPTDCCHWAGGSTKDAGHSGAYAVTSQQTWSFSQNRQYAHVIVEIRPGILTIIIDIKPGSYPNSINRSSQGNLPVALLGSSDFDVTMTDPRTVVFANASPLNIGQSAQDVNGDGRLDMVFHFSIQSLNLRENTTEACLTGQTLSSQSFKGCDSVRLVR